MTVLIGGQPAARVGDMHVCPMQTPAPVPVPHVGGPILPPGVPTVLIGGLPAACVGDSATCTGPPDAILPPGCLTVLIGPGGGGGGGGGFGMSSTGSGSTQIGGESGDANVVEIEGESEEHYLDVKFTDNGGMPISGLSYHLEGPGGVDEDGPLTGQIRKAGVESGTFTIELRAITEAKWSQASARDGETVQMQVSVEGIDDGTPAILEVFERNPNSPDKSVRKIEDAEVQGDKIEAEWHYEWLDEEVADSDDQEKRPKPQSPGFYFNVSVAGALARSGILNYKDFIEVSLVDVNDDPVPDAKFVAYLPDGSVREGTLDSSGYAKIEKVPPGAWSVSFPDREHFGEKS
jgi:uncharacterized Zn-binding protein involved in type VI secretion